MIAPTSGSRSSAVPNFAGVLASMEQAWNDDGLADDVATISYERALRKQARPRVGGCEAEAGARGPGFADMPGAAGGAMASAKPQKSASITIRLSEPECAQVRQRAAEAGLTVSAYLRSCTLEADSLRAQVKETLAQLRSSSSAAVEPEFMVERHHRVKSLFVRVWCWFRQFGWWRRAMGVNPVNPFAPVRY